MRIAAPQSRERQGVSTVTIETGRRPIIDTHQHLWVISERSYDWIVPETGALYADFRPEDVAADAAAAGVTGCVLVQAADTYDDTFYMMSVAERDSRVVGVVGWVPLDRTDEATTALRLYASSGMVKGVRALTHSYADEGWLRREPVDATLRVLTDLGLTLDVVVTSLEQLRTVEAVAAQHPSLTIIIDHLASPPIADQGWQPWAESLAAVARHPRVMTKVSGLSTMSAADTWTSFDWQRYVDHALAVFGSERMMVGSDWPVSVLNGGYLRAMEAIREVGERLTEDQRDDLFYRTAHRVYRVPLPAGATT